MLAAAVYNFSITDAYNVSQTIYAVRIMASSFTFYRLDVLLAYMNSLSHGRPKERLVVFRWGGNHSNLGLDIGNNGAQRQQIISIIGSIYTVCAETAQCTADKKLPTTNTQDRLDYLYH